MRTVLYGGVSATEMPPGINKHFVNTQPPGVEAWQCVDLNASALRTTLKGRPEWYTVKWRTTFDANERRLIEVCRSVKDIE